MRLVFVSCCAVLLPAWLGSTSFGQPCSQPTLLPEVLGCWQKPLALKVSAPAPGTPTGPMQAVHSIALHNWRILCVDWLNFGDAPRVVLFDPNYPNGHALNIQYAPNGPPGSHNLFCSEHSILSDWKVFFGGGGPTPPGMEVRTSIYDPVAGSIGTWSAGPVESWPFPDGGATFHNERWYPTCTTLGDGRILVTDGFAPAYYPEQTRANIPVIATPPSASNPTWQWTPLYDAWYYEEAPNPPRPYQWFLYPYPFMFQTTNDVFFAGGAEMVPGVLNEMVSRRLSVELETWTDVEPIAIRGGSAALYAADTVIKAGGGNEPGEGNGEDCEPTIVTDRAFRIRLSDATPTWEEIAPMNEKRIHFYLIPTPDGKVIAIGGTRGGPTHPDMCESSNAVLTPEAYSPSLNSWTLLNPGEVARIYHSSAVLMWDGAIFFAGGQVDDLPVSVRHTYEIFYPPYFFRGQRPIITSAPAQIRVGKKFRVDTPDAASITRVRLIRPGAATHSFDQNQRMVDLQFTLDNSTTPASLKVVAPPDTGIAPLGYYWLFICKDYINSTGNEVGAIPSTSETVRLVPALSTLP